METILDRRWLFHYTNMTAKLEREEKNVKKISTVLKAPID